MLTISIPKARFTIAFAALLMIGAAGAALGETDQAFMSKVANQVLVETAEGHQTSFIVYMSDQADLSTAYTMTDPDARGWYVYLTLKEHAQASQAPIKAALDQAGVPYTSFWGANMIVVDGDRGVVEAMAVRADVAAIEPNSVIDGVDDIDDPADPDEGDTTDAVETGVTQTVAPTLWGFGFHGEGMVVANQDTGMRWTHAALRTKYRGWSGAIATSDHNYNWWDSIHAQITNGDGGTPSPATNPCGRNIVVPCDDHGHGTHTTGTTVGDDFGAGAGTGTNQVGVAPGAKWIGCRNMDQGNGRASTYTECFQFFLAPTDVTGANADPSKRPHTMNNSWGCPQAGELCAPNVMKTIVENSQASGIFVEASNGNEGPNCNTTTDPPAIYEAAFSTGSITALNAVSSFSSRGVVAVDGSNRMKPDLVARGSTVRSSTRNSDTSYTNMSGTSMAGPHVVGTVAVLWSARARLVRDVPRTKWLLTRSANPAVTVPNNAAGCGGTGTIPNNHFGWGRVDVFAAYMLEPSLDQAITFAPIADRLVDDADFGLNAVATSDLPVRYAATGTCTISGNVVHIVNVGNCTVIASQEGLDEYGIQPSAPKPWYPALDVSHVFHIRYPYSGFFTPIDNSNANLVQAGSGVPIKFSLGADRGMNILAPGSPRSTPISCTTGAPAGSPDATSPAGRSGLNFDATTGQYSYVWKTDKSWAGSCRLLEIVLADNTVHTATFQFKK